MSCHQLNRCHNVYPSSLAHFSLFVCVHCILCVTVCVFVQTELTSQNSPNCMFKILPRYKVRSVGDEVSGTAHWLRLGCSNELHTSMGYRRTCKSLCGDSEDCVCTYAMVLCHRHPVVLLLYSPCVYLCCTLVLVHYSLPVTCHLIKTCPPPSLMMSQGCCIRPNHSSFFSIVTDKGLHGRSILHFNLFPLLRNCSTVALPMP